MHRRSLWKLACSWLVAGLLVAAPPLSLAGQAVAEEKTTPLTREEKLEKFRREAVTVWGTTDYGGAIRLQTEEPGERWFIQKGRFTKISDLEFLKLAGEDELYQKYNQKRWLYTAAAAGCLIGGFLIAYSSEADTYDYVTQEDIDRSQLWLVGSLGASALLWYQGKGGISGHYLTFDQAKELANKYNQRLLRELSLDLTEETSA